MTSPDQHEPALYQADVGDEMFMGQQAVMSEVRRRLVERLDGDAQRTAVAVVDDFMREMVADEQQDDEQDDEPLWNDPGDRHGRSEGD